MARSIAAEEWRGAWQLPFVVMLATTGASLIVYSAGVFMPAVTATFGWTRAAFSSGFMVSTLVGLVTMPLAGRMADRFGPRPIALAGIVALVLAICAFGQIDGILWHWWLSFALYTLAGSLMSPSILTMAVVSRFNSARGLALAVALSGNGLAAAIWPPLATLYVAELGWRMAFAALAVTWALVAFPLFFFFFHAARDLPSARPTVAAEPAIGFGAAWKSRPFLCLLWGGVLFIVASVSILVNFVPILRDRGLTAGEAAGVAATAGMSAIVGRVVIGFLLDRMRARRIAVAAFGLPAVAALILLGAGGSVPLAIVAAVLLGLGIGAEMDIATYLAARYFGLKNFGSIFAVIIAFYGVGAGLGPLAGNAIYDYAGSYTPLLFAAIPLVLASAGLIALLPGDDTAAG